MYGKVRVAAYATPAPATVTLGPMHAKAALARFTVRLPLRVPVTPSIGLSGNRGVACDADTHLSSGPALEQLRC